MKRIPQRSTIVCGKTGQGKTVFVKSEIEQIVKETNTKVVVCISGSSNYEEICNDLKGQCTTIADLEDVIFADDVQLQIFKITETIEKTPVIQRIEEIVNSIWDKNSRLYVDELRIDTLQLLKVCKRNEIQCTITEQRLTQEMKSAFDEVIILAPLGKHGENTTLIQERNKGLMKLGLDRIEKVARDITTHYIRATQITEREGKSKNYYVNLSDCFQKHTEHMNHDDKRRVFIMMVQRNYITEKDHTERGDMEQYFTRLESVKLSSENYSERKLCNT